MIFVQYTHIFNGSNCLLRVGISVILGSLVLLGLLLVKAPYSFVEISADEDKGNIRGHEGSSSRRYTSKGNGSQGRGNQVQEKTDKTSKRRFQTEEAGSPDKVKEQLNSVKDQGKLDANAIDGLLTPYQVGCCSHQCIHENPDRF